MNWMILLSTALLISTAAQAETPTSNAPLTEAQTLGRELAEQGMLMQLLPMMAMKETEEMVAQMPDLSTSEKETLRNTARENFSTGSSRIFAIQGRIYADNLSIDDLHTLVDFNRSAASKRYQTVLPKAIEGTVKSLAGMDFKGDTLAVFCKKTGKGCKVVK